MAFSKISVNSQIFLEELKKSENKEQKIRSYLSDCEPLNSIVPDFEDELEWFNTTAQKLSFNDDLKGKIVVLDFFTYCCVNCMHVLPDLHALEESYSIETGVVVIGVHSAKFDNEKVSSNIKSAILRYGITHPVVNDSDALLWNKMEIRCWPTFVIVSPEGKALLYMVGEGHKEALMSVIEVAIGFYQERGLLRNHSLPINLSSELTEKTTLSFPGKICCAGNDLAISDTGNNRILMVSKDGIIKRTFGGLEQGWDDTTSQKAKFNAPQGITFWNGFLYVADTENHAIRKIDLDKDIVSTIAGTGTQGLDKEGGKTGVNQPISSPWDVAVGPCPGTNASNEDGVLYIAMAGSHQIWASFLKDGSWLKGGAQESGTCIRFAGSGNEENRNNSYPHKASFAQPSGITVAQVNGKKYLYIADSESSCVRSVELSNGAVKACVGGERDPMNLFAYGDKDGKGIEAKLQHPLAVAWNSFDGMIYTADSYNHKVKVIDPVKCTCKTLAGTGKAGYKDGGLAEAQFNEPGGLEISEDGKEIFVADTNNHRIRIIDLERKSVETLEIVNSNIPGAPPAFSNSNTQPKSKMTKRLAPKNAPIEELETVRANLELPVSFAIEIQLPEDCHFTEEAESIFAITLENEGDSKVTELMRGRIDQNGEIKTSVNVDRASRSSVTLLVDVLVYFCSQTGVCLMKSFILKQNVLHDISIKDNRIINHKQTLTR